MPDSCIRFVKVRRAALGEGSICLSLVYKLVNLTLLKLVSIGKL